jgi:hypothetical protein
MSVKINSPELHRACSEGQRLCVSETVMRGIYSEQLAHLGRRHGVRIMIAHGQKDNPLFEAVH